MTLSMMCLVATLYNEVRGEAIIDHEKVTQVILNRTAESGDSLCTEVHKKGQFSVASPNLHRFCATGVGRKYDCGSYFTLLEEAENFMKCLVPDPNGIKYFNEKSMGVRHPSKHKAIRTRKHVYY